MNVCQGPSGSLLPSRPLFLIRSLIQTRHSQRHERLLPGSGCDSYDPSPMKISLEPRRLVLIVILALAVLPYCINLGASSLWDSNEAFYAQTPREMIEAGDYVNPTFNYQPRFNKPPLVYWVVALFYKAFGISEAVERLPIALGALVLIASALFLGQAAFSTNAGLIAAIALASMPTVPYVLSSDRHRRLPGDVHEPCAVDVCAVAKESALAEILPRADVCLHCSGRSHKRPCCDSVAGGGNFALSLHLSPAWVCSES